MEPNLLSPVSWKILNNQLKQNPMVLFSLLSIYLDNPIKRILAIFSNSLITKLNVNVDVNDKVKCIIRTKGNKAHSRDDWLKHYVYKFNKTLTWTQHRRSRSFVCTSWKVRIHATSHNHCGHRVAPWTRGFLKLTHFVMGESATLFYCHLKVMVLGEAQHVSPRVNPNLEPWLVSC